MLTKIIIRENDKPFKSIIISSDTKGRELILEIERKVVPESIDFCIPLVRTNTGFSRVTIDYIIERREQFIEVYS